MKQGRTYAIYSVLAGLFALGSAAPADAQVVWDEAPAVPMIKLTGKQLRAQGIALKSAGAAAFPHSCATVGSPGLSVSNDMLAAFIARGFTLESLCLGLTSAFGFDPESGKPMPFASLSNAGVPLNLPECFKRATPLTDCRWSYDHNWGGKTDTQDRRDFGEIAKAIDSIAQKQIGSGRSEWITMPASNGCGTRKDPFDVQVNGRRLCAILEKVVITKRLPLGYGYSFHPPEGDDPAEDETDLSTYAKKSGVVPVWSATKPSAIARIAHSEAADSEAATLTNIPEYKVSVTFSPAAEHKLKSSGEGVSVSVTYHVGPSGTLVGTEKNELANDHTVSFGGVGVPPKVAAKVRGQPIMVNINVFSSRKSSTYNILDCSIYEGDVSKTRLVPLNCKLIAER
jgi:hypothetical protein